MNTDKLNVWYNLAKNNWRNTPQIVNGFVRKYKNEKGLLPEEEREVAKERLEICIECPENSYKKPHDLKPKLSQKRTDFHCTDCGCVIEAKVTVMEQFCPLSKWKAVTKEELQQRKIELTKENG